MASGEADSEEALGILPDRHIAGLAEDGAIQAPEGIPDYLIQPASLDLRLGLKAWRIRASFLPGPGATVQNRLDKLAMHEIDLSGGVVLETGCVYVATLLESLALPPDIAGAANPKSSTGRIDVLARLITDRCAVFDQAEKGYHGPLYVEIAPRTFSVLVRTGSRLNQMRFRRGEGRLDAGEQLALQEHYGLIDREVAQGTPFHGIPVTVDLAGTGGDGLLGFRARRHASLIDVDETGHYNPALYWEPIHANGDNLILNPGDFHIFASREAVSVPPEYAAEMVAYDTQIGEFRVHYAGFFDPGFGAGEAEGKGSRAVLEVRSHEVPFVIEQNQVVGTLVYDRLLAAPDRLYGDGIGSSYQRQGLALSRHFKPFAPRGRTRI